MDIKKKYSAKGVVLGYMWGGGTGFYPTVTLEGFDSIEALSEAAEKKIKDNSLDKGMGFEALKGAVLEVEERSTVTVDGLDYHREDYTSIIVGELTEEESDYAMDFEG